MQSRHKEEYLSTPESCSGMTPLHMAAKIGNASMVQLLMDHGAPLEAQLFDMYDTPLLLAARGGAPSANAAVVLGMLHEMHEDMRGVVEGGANIEVRERSEVFNNTPLHLACSHGVFALAEAILAKNPLLVNATNEWKETPLFLAMTSNKEDAGRIVTLLLEHGADVNGNDFELETPLHHGMLKAARMGTVTPSVLECTALLLEHGVSDIDAMDGFGDCALHIAVRYGLEEMVHLLHQHKASLSPRDSKGWTPLHHAAYHGYASFVPLFVKATLGARTMHGSTALHLAAQQGHAGCAQRILVAGAIPDVRDSNGFLSEDLARRHSHFELAHLLHAAVLIAHQERKEPLSKKAMPTSLRELDGPSQRRGQSIRGSPKRKKKKKKILSTHKSSQAMVTVSPYRSGSSSERKQHRFVVAKLYRPPTAAEHIHDTAVRRKEKQQALKKKREQRTHRERLQEISERRKERELLEQVRQLRKEEQLIKVKERVQEERERRQLQKLKQKARIREKHMEQEEERLAIQTRLLEEAKYRSQVKQQLLLEREVREQEQVILGEKAITRIHLQRKERQSNTKLATEHAKISLLREMKAIRKEEKERKQREAQRREEEERRRAEQLRKTSEKRKSLERSMQEARRKQRQHEVHQRQRQWTQKVILAADPDDL